MIKKNVLPSGLICNLLTHPEECLITQKDITFGWIINSPYNCDYQTAYKIIVSSSYENCINNIADIWDSGKISSNESINILYKGTPLKSNTSYWWSVCVWTKFSDVESTYAMPQKINIGDLEYIPKWNGESRWVQLHDKSSNLWTFENRQKISYNKVLPCKIIKRDDNVWFVDFKKDAFAYPKITLEWTPKDNKSKYDLTINLGEKSIDNKIDEKPGGGILFNQYTLTIKPGLHEYIIDIPRFIPHYPCSQTMPEHMQEVIPFRYMEIICKDEHIELKNAEQYALYYRFDNNSSYFESSDNLLNQIYDLCKYSVYINTFNGDYASSQRERMMYEADVYIQQMGHYAVDREFAIQRYSLLNIIYNSTWPTEWIPHTIFIAWADYMHTGDSSILKKYYDDLKPKTLIALTEKNDLISTKTGLDTDEFYKSIHLNGKINDIVDWPNASYMSDIEGGESDHYEFCDYNTVVNAFHYKSLEIMSKIALVVDNKNDSEFYKQRMKKVKNAFNKYFFNNKTGLYVDGINSSHSSLHANMFSLLFGLAEDNMIDNIIKFIKSKNMACGVYGANYLLECLYNYNEPQKAFDLLTSKTDRSWYNMIKCGSTITTEAWDIKYKNNGGWNHAWSCSPVHIIPRKLMGVEPLLPGFEKILIAPDLSTLDWAKLKLPTIRGYVYIDFKTTDGITINLNIPTNMTAKLVLPITDHNIYINNKKIQYSTENNKIIIDNISSGKYTIRF